MGFVQQSHNKIRDTVHMGDMCSNQGKGSGLCNQETGCIQGSWEKKVTRLIGCTQGKPGFSLSERGRTYKHGKEGG